ncbi:MAG: hypothetical protein U9N82_09130 [Thermodesulfobacteriota bacterium]|nr:hypothetical protein [Thermodesulfobacteriota bacterium]
MPILCYLRRYENQVWYNKISVKITPIRVIISEDGLCKGCFTHLPGTYYENHLSFQVIKNVVDII